MSDEEKKAIEFVKSELQDEKIARNDYQSLTGLYGNLEIETVLNIVEKQSKEIEELKTDRDKFKKALGKRITYCNELEKDLFENCNNYVVSKDKIKSKIEELENEKEKYFEKQVIQHEIEVLQSLLEKE